MTDRMEKKIASSIERLGQLRRLNAPAVIIGNEIGLLLSFLMLQHGEGVYTGFADHTVRNIYRAYERCITCGAEDVYDVGMCKKCCDGVQSGENNAKAE